jgi:hypothetical protein
MSISPEDPEIPFTLSLVHEKRELSIAVYCLVNLP